MAVKAMIKNVILDFDDTLSHTHRVEYKRHMLIAKEIGLRLLLKDEFLGKWGSPWSVFIADLWPDTDVKKFQIAYKKRHYNKRNRLIKWVREAINLLRKRGFTIHIISSRDNKSLMLNLNHHGIQNNFTQIHSGDHGKFHKPDPRVFTEFLEAHGLQKEETMYVGDLLIDYEGASKAGITFVAVLTGAHDKKKFVQAGLNPKNIIPSIKDLPEWLERNNK